MILATDVYYYENQAKASGVLFKNWGDKEAFQDISVYIEKTEDYISGSFYKRELPCLLDLINTLTEKPTCIIVDGFVTLGETQKPGLGMYLYEALNKEIPVIGVAKKGFHGTPDNTRVYRGASNKPLFVTAVGLDLENAKSFIKQMHGAYRFPTLLKLVDSLCRDVE